MTLDERAHLLRSGLSNGSKAASLRIRMLHVGLASDRMAAIDEELKPLRILLDAAKDEVQRLAAKGAP
jgi:hypothetical protein